MKEVTHDEASSWWKRPERVVLAVSVDAKGLADIIALGWKMRTSGIPPMYAISIGHSRYSHKLISESKEFVLSIPGEDLSEQVLYVGTVSGRKVDKFKETGLTPVPSKIVRPPLIQECIVNHECNVVGQLNTGDHTIFVGEVLVSWLADEKKQNLSSIGYESGYVHTGGGSGYRFGIIQP